MHTHTLAHTNTHTHIHTQVAVNDKYIAVSEAKYNTQRLALLDAVTGDVIRRISEKGQAAGQVVWATGLRFTRGGECQGCGC